MQQYIVFKVLEQKFALSIHAISRIVPLSSITPVPDTADSIMGVMESEEQVIPVIDLTKRFFDKRFEETMHTQVIIVYWNDLQIGIIVDEIIEIIQFSEEQIDRELEKITALEEPKEVTPIKSFIRTDDEIVLEVSQNELFDMKGTLMIQELIESYL